MSSFYVFSLLLLCLIQKLTILNCYQFEIWGDLTTKIIVGSTKSKYGIPFIPRTVEINYPNEFQGNEKGTIRGIKHWDQLDDEECQSEARIIKGGLNQKKATVRITSNRGCGINSLVEFFIEKS